MLLILYHIIMIININIIINVIRIVMRVESHVNIFQITLTPNP